MGLTFQQSSLPHLTIQIKLQSTRESSGLTTRRNWWLLTTNTLNANVAVKSVVTVFFVILLSPFFVTSTLLKTSSCFRHLYHNRWGLITKCNNFSQKRKSVQMHAMTDYSAIPSCLNRVANFCAFSSERRVRNCSSSLTFGKCCQSNR